MTKSREFKIWSSMRRRCENPAHHAFANYGGRGIAVCKRWQTFANFFEDVGTRPSRAHSLDRIDVNGDYEAGNVRWATQMTQMHNLRKNIFLTHDGETCCIQEWSRKTGLHPSTIAKRFRHGMPAAECLRPSKPRFPRGGRIAYAGNVLTVEQWAMTLGVRREAIRARQRAGRAPDGSQSAFTIAAPDL